MENIVRRTTTYTTISNKRRLGRSEVDLVQDMYNGVKSMIEKEKELTPHDKKI